MSTPSAKSNLLEMSTEGFLPPLCCISSAIKAQLELAELPCPKVFVFFGQFNIDISLDLSIEVCSPDVVDHNHTSYSIRLVSGCMTNHQPQRLERWRSSIQRIITADVEFSSNQSGSIIGFGGVAFVHIDPPNTYNLSSCGVLVLPRHHLVHSQFLEILHLECTGCLHQ